MVSGSYGTTEAEGDADIEAAGAPRHSQVTLFTCFLCLTIIAEGYDIGVLNGALVRIRDDLGLSVWASSAIVMVTPIGFIPGALMGGQIADYCGRKGALLVNSILMIVGPQAMALAPNASSLIVARFIVGFSIGVALVVVSLYIAEVAPQELRGRLTSLEEAFLNVGIVAGYIFCWLLRGTANDWRVMLAIGSVLPALVFLTMLLPQVPESPRWLYSHGHVAEAERVLMNFVGKAEAQRDMQTMSTPSADKLGKEAFVTWSNLLSHASWNKDSLRRRLLAGCSVVLASSACGSLVISYYSSSMMKTAMGEEKAFLATIIMGVVKLTMVLVEISLVERVGRRPMILLSSVLVCLASAWLAIAFRVNAGSFFLVVGFCFFMAGFSLGLGPLSYAYATEVFVTEWRAKALGLAFFISRVAGAASTMIFPVLVEVIGISNALWLQCVVCIGLFGMLWAMVFESKGQLLDDTSSPC